MPTSRSFRPLTALAAAGAMALVPTVGLAASASATPGVPTAVVSARPVEQTSVPVTGQLADGTLFTGAVSDLSTSVEDGVLMLSGTITGTGLPASGTDFSAPVGLAADAACTILTLDLGPLDLDLLGLVIELNEINLDITAVPGPGNLLGNLLCAIVGLLDGGGPLGGISALLNRLLTGLGL